MAPSELGPRCTVPNLLKMYSTPLHENAFLNSVLDGMAEPVMVIGKDYQVLMANASARKNAPRPAAPEACKCYQLLHHRDRPCDGIDQACPLKMVMETRDSVSVTHEHLNAEGESRLFEVLASPLWDNDNNLVGVITSERDITECVRERDALRETENKFRSLFNSGSDAIYVHQLGSRGRLGNFTEVNDKACQMLGYSREELLAMGPGDIDAPESAADMPDILDRLVSGRPVIFERTHLTKEGGMIPVEISAQAFQQGGVTSVLSIVRDISSRRQAELEYKTIVQSATDAYVLIDGQGRILNTNDAYCSMLGYSRAELLGMSLPDIDRLKSPQECRRHFIEFKDRGRLRLESRHKGKDGQIIDVEFSMKYLDRQGGLLITCINDITERKQLENEIRKLAFYDTLTDLPNRRLLLDRLEHALSQAKRFRRSMGIMFLDLDRFKEVNDTLGHFAGDELLRQVAQRLVGCVRAGDTVSRTGGDEFVILLEEISQPQDVALVAEKVIGSFIVDFPFQGQSIHMGASIGIAIYPVDGDDDIEMLMRKADHAMYEAKAAGRNCYRYYRDPE